MSNTEIHLGPYIWTRGPGEENPRPMWGSQKHLEFEELERQRKEAALATPEGQEWLKKHAPKTDEAE